jgi:hypothetical protein
LFVLRVRRNTGSVTHPAETSLLISSDYFQILNRLL